MNIDLNHLANLCIPTDFQKIILFQDLSIFISQKLIKFLLPYERTHFFLFNQYSLLNDN